MILNPQEAGVSAPAVPPTLSYDARVVPFRDGSEHARPHPRAWFVTFGQGGPARGTYTEIVVDVPEDEDGAPLPEHVTDQIVREVAVRLYGTAWAFHYRPEQYAEAVERWGLSRRELVTVTDVQVYE